MFDISQYKKEKSLEIFTLLKNRKVIYLDINYWIKLREESKKIHSDERKFLNIITALSHSKHCIFPISEITFSEVMKQRDLSTRKETIELIDKLSEGVCFMPMKERIQLETRV